VKAYWAILSAAFRMHLQYRAAALAGFGTQLFWGLIRVMIFGAFYRSSASPQPMSYPQTVTYLWLTQAMLLLLPMRPNPEIRAMIQLQALTQNIRYRIDGKEATADTGFQLAAGAISLVPVPNLGISIIEEVAGAIIQYQFVR